MLRDDDLARRVEADYVSAGLSSKRMAMLDFAAKLTRSPGAMLEDDVVALRSEGFSDVDILHITEVVAYFAYANRISDGLGIPLEDWIPDDGTSEI